MSRTRQLRTGSHAAGSEGGALGADDLLPLVVYVVIKAKAASLPAELAYVADFLAEGQVHGRQGYALVSLQCACRVASELEWGEELLRAAPPEGGAADEPPGADASAAAVGQRRDDVTSATTLTPASGSASGGRTRRDEAVEVD